MRRNPFSPPQIAFKFFRIEKQFENDDLKSYKLVQQRFTVEAFESANC